MRDTGSWRLAKSEHICWDSIKAKISTQTTCFGTNQIFKNDFARITYLKFIKFGDAGDETGIRSVICFDAVVPDAVDSFAWGPSVNLTNIFSKNLKSSNVSGFLATENKTNERIIVSQETSRRRKFLSPIAAVILRFYCYTWITKIVIFVIHLSMQKLTLLPKRLFSVMKGQKRLIDGHRQHTISCRMHGISQYWITPIAHELTDLYLVLIWNRLQQLCSSF